MFSLGALNNKSVQKIKDFSQYLLSRHLDISCDCLDLNQGPQILPCPEVVEVGSLPALVPGLSPAQFHQRQGKFSGSWLCDSCNGLLNKKYKNNDNIVKQEITTLFE